MSILDELAAYAAVRVKKAKAQRPLEELRRQAESMDNETGFPFEKALAAPGLSFICEVKKASPSKGLIAPHFPYLDIAKDYEAGGAAAISCLTEPKWFLGADHYLEEIAQEVTVPVLRKDFTIDPYMIYEAKIMGASAVLLICALLNQVQLAEYREIADSLGLSCLVEAHNEDEIKAAVASGARIIGVNNRNLKDFSVDLANSDRLRACVPPDILYVSESGIRNAEDVAAQCRLKADAVLIGEALMRSTNRQATLETLRAACP